MLNEDLTKEELLLKIRTLESIIDNIGGYIYAKDTNARYTYANKSCLELLNVSLDEIIGQKDHQFFDAALSTQIQQNDKKVLQQDSEFISEVDYPNRVTGESKTYRSYKRTLTNEAGEIIGMSGIATDISQQKSLERVVSEQNQLLDAVLNNVDAFIYMKDESRKFLYVNDKTAAMFGKSYEEIVGQKDSDVIGQDMADHFWDSDKLVFEQNERHTTDEVTDDGQGNTKHYISMKIPYQVEGGPKTLIGFSTDVTELYQLKEEFKKQANTDVLTGLYNRRYFFEHATKEFSRSTRHGLDMSIMSIDIDYFKSINDTYGHPVGDKVLIELAKNLLSSLRQEDILARIGGEEFSIILPNTNLEQAKHIAYRTCQLKNTFNINEYESIDIQMSIGLVVKKVSDRNFDDLFIRADNALYNAKSSGRNKVYFE